MSTLGLVCALFACSSEPPLTFDGQLPRFITNSCACSTNVQACETEVRSDMETARMKLDDAGKERCAMCMQAKSVVFQKQIDSSCSSAISQDDTNMVVAACGNNKDACAGYP